MFTHKNNRRASTFSTASHSTTTSTSTHAPSAYTTHSYRQHYHEPTTMVESLLETTSSKLTEGTKLALSTISHSGIIAHYFDPVIRYFHQLYIEQPKGSVVRLGMWGCLVGGLLPVGCLVGGVVMTSVGCLVVSGSALLVIQMFCLGFTGCVLAPAGVLTALTVGLPSLALYGLYSSCNFLLSILSH